ncbi:MAG: hypothetical protein KKH61_20655 [Gammaproteobacteria bacterium]|nr:hypothetical protein [Gammaproteobacteria bacterium]
MAMAAEKVQEMNPAERAYLSREINKALELDEQIKALAVELGEVKARIWDKAGEPGTFRSNKGFVQIQARTTISIPTDSRAGLMAALGDDYHRLVEESVSLKPKSGLRRLLTTPGPAERERSVEMMPFVTVRESISFTLKRLD